MTNTPSDMPANDAAPVPPGRVRSGRARIWLCRALTAIGSLSVVLVLLVASPLTSWIYSKMDAQDPLEKADYIICLGGEPGRVVEAARLLRDGYAPTMIVTNVGAAAERMRSQAIEWGAPPDRVIVDDTSTRTADHPVAVAKAAGIDIRNDTCIIVTSYTHLSRARAVFEKAGYRNIVMQEPRWERQSRDVQGMSIRSRFLIFPKIVYEGAGWILYFVLGDL